MSERTAPETDDLAQPGPRPSRRILPSLRSRASLPATRLRSAVIAGGVLFAVLAALGSTRLPSLLPGYPAVVLAFLVWAVAPGWLPQRTLFASRETGLAERLVFAFLISMALAGPAGLLALRLHWSLHTFALLYAASAAAAGGLALLWRRDEEDGPGGAEPPSVFPTVPLLLMIGVPLLAILTSPLWAGDRIARDFDDTVYMGYVHDYTNSDSLDASQPFLDTRRGSFGRMAINVWIVVEALVADNAGVEAFDLLLDYLPPLMTLLAVGAMFTLARGLFRNTKLALLAGLFVLLYAALDLAPHEGYGRNVLLRIGEDKMVASFVMLPVVLLLGTKYLAQPSSRGYLALLLGVAAMLVVHPMAVIFLGIGLASLAVLRVLVERSVVVGRGTIALLLPVGALALGFLVRSWLVDESHLVIAEPFRGEFHLVEFAGGFVMGSYHLMLHPFMLAAILLAVPLWLVAPRDAGNQLMLAAVLGVLLVTYVPLLATPLADATTNEAVWRLPWLVPVPLILAYALHTGATRLLSGRQGIALPGCSSALPNGVAAMAGVLLVVSGAFLVQEHYALADDGAFYSRTSNTELLAWTGGSIFLGGVERAFSSDWRPTPTERGLLDYLAANAQPGSIVLLPHSINDRFFGGVLDDVLPLDHRGGAEYHERAAAVDAFSTGRLRGAELRAALDKYDVDYVVVRRHSRSEDAFDTFAEYRAAEFEAGEGTPEMTWRPGDGGWYQAWALDPNDPERIGGLRFTVPEDIDPDDTTLTFHFVLAPSERVMGEQTVSIVLSYFESGEDTTQPDVISVVSDIEMEDGTPAGTLFVWRRPARSTVKPGATYGFAITRLADWPEDTFTEDLWFASLRVTYSPDAAQELTEAPYKVYEYAP